MWLINLLKELGNKDGDTVMLRVDNISTINLVENLTTHGRRKHIEMRFH